MDDVKKQAKEYATHTSCPERNSAEWTNAYLSFLAGAAYQKEKDAEKIKKLAEALIGGSEKGGVFWREDALEALREAEKDGEL